MALGGATRPGCLQRQSPARRGVEMQVEPTIPGLLDSVQRRQTVKRRVVSGPHFGSHCLARDRALPGVVVASAPLWVKRDLSPSAALPGYGPPQDIKLDCWGHPSRPCADLCLPVVLCRSSYSKLHQVPANPDFQQKPSGTHSLPSKIQERTSWETIDLVATAGQILELFIRPRYKRQKVCTHIPTPALAASSATFKQKVFFAQPLKC